MNREDDKLHILAGLIAGTLATLPMTAAMVLMHRRLPWSERYPLPPSEITGKVAASAGLRQHLGPQEQKGLTIAAHFGYGAVAGAVYAPLSKHLPGSAPARGVAFGLAVWTSSYLGLLPALGILEPATEHPPRRIALMIAAHVVFGAALGWAFEWLGPRDRLRKVTHPLRDPRSDHLRKIQIGREVK